MDRISKSKDATQARSTVRSLSDRDSHTTGISLLYKGMVYANDRANAYALVQEYAKISGRESDINSRKVVVDPRCLKRSIRTTPWQQIEEAFSPGELQLALS